MVPSSVTGDLSTETAVSLATALQQEMGFSMVMALGMAPMGTQLPVVVGMATIATRTPVPLAAMETRLAKGSLATWAASGSLCLLYQGLDQSEVSSQFYHGASIGALRSCVHQQ